MADRRPVCNYGVACFRRNPVHFLNFQHPGHPLDVPLPHSSHSVPTSRDQPRTARAADAPASRCKFGCGRLRKKSGARTFDTCCRACGSSQGAGFHDRGCVDGPAQPKAGQQQSAGDADSDARALLLIDQALEVSKRAQSEAVKDDAEHVTELYTESLALLDEASRLLREGHVLLPLIAQISEACRLRTRSNISKELEDDVDMKIHTLISQLEEKLLEFSAGTDIVLATSDLVALCRCGCRRPVAPFDRERWRFFDTCCQECARCGGSGDHSAACTERARLVAGTDLALIEDALEPWEEGAPQDHPAKEALRVLGLADDWPTELTMREVRRRYMREALATHPDKGPQSESEDRTRRFQELAAAYATLEVQMALLESSSAPSGPSARAGAPAGAIEEGQAALPPLSNSAPASASAGVIVASAAADWTPLDPAPLPLPLPLPPPLEPSKQGSPEPAPVALGDGQSTRAVSTKATAKSETPLLSPSIPPVAPAAPAAPAAAPSAPGPKPSHHKDPFQNCKCVVQ